MQTLTHISGRLLLVVLRYIPGKWLIHDVSACYPKHASKSGEVALAYESTYDAVRFAPTKASNLVVMVVQSLML